jgi:hypothetical protein
MFLAHEAWEQGWWREYKAHAPPKGLLNILATFAEFEVDLLPMRTREGMTPVAKVKGELRGKQPKLSMADYAFGICLRNFLVHSPVSATNGRAGGRGRPLPIVVTGLFVRYGRVPASQPRRGGQWS